MKIYETRTRVRYAETDASGIVYYGAYFVYFELGRVEMFRQLGLVYDRHLPIADTACRYRASARFDDELLISTWVQELRRKGFVLGSRVERLGDGGGRELLVEGHTGMVTADDQGHPVPLPDAFARALGEG
ncbi:MAG: thioesterase family protein [Pseudomonadota bacterium]